MKFRKRKNETEVNNNLRRAEKKERNAGTCAEKKRRWMTKGFKIADVIKMKNHEV
jgi:hypothetical protein